MSQTKLRRLTEQEYQIVFLYCLDSMTSGFSDRNDRVWTLAISSFINNVSLEVLHDILHIVNDDNYERYQTYLEINADEN